MPVAAAPEPVPFISCTPGISVANSTAVLPVGSASTTSRVITTWRLTFCTSTIGDVPVTVIVSSTAPTRRSASTVAVKPVVSSIPSRRTELKPAA